MGQINQLVTCFAQASMRSLPLLDTAILYWLYKLAVDFSKLRSSQVHTMILWGSLSGECRPEEIPSFTSKAVGPASSVLTGRAMIFNL